MYITNMRPFVYMTDEIFCLGKADPNKADGFRRLPLFYACREGHPRAVRQILYGDYPLRETVNLVKPVNQKAGNRYCTLIVINELLTSIYRSSNLVDLLLQLFTRRLLYLLKKSVG